MKRIVIIACSILLVFCILTIFLQLYFNPERFAEKSDEEVFSQLVAELKDDNAAKYYFMAYQNLRYPSSDDNAFWDRYLDFFETGWLENDPALEKFIADNEKALELVRKGVAQSNCSIPLKRGDIVLRMSGMFRAIGRLLTMDTSLLNKRGDFAGAGETFIVLLRFTKDITDKGIFVHLLSGYAIEDLAYYALNSHLATLDDRVICEKLLNEMIEIEQRRATMRELLENEFGYTETQYRSWAEYVLDFDDAVGAENIFEHSLYAWKRAFRFLGYLHIRRGEPKYMKTVRPVEETVLSVSEDPFPKIFNGELEQRIPNDELSKEHFRATYIVMTSIAMAHVDHRANIVKTALHLHLLKHGEYPESLDDLAALMRQEMLIDPFSMKRFVYKRTDDGYVFYSFGPNLKDDGGVDSGYPFKDGDLVYMLPENEDEYEPESD
jgi:hypothetical protein